MAGIKTKRSEGERKPHPTVQHESSADNAQDLGIRKNLESEKEEVSASSNRKRRHSGSEGTEQERGSNH